MIFVEILCLVWERDFYMTILFYLSSLKDGSKTHQSSSQTNLNPFSHFQFDFFLVLMLIRFNQVLTLVVFGLFIYFLIPRFILSTRILVAPRPGLFLGLLLSQALVTGMNPYLLLMKHILPHSCLTIRELFWFLI